LSWAPANTRLWVERGLTDTAHTVYARLAEARDNSSISGQPIKLDVNGTVYSLTTYSNGCVTQPLSLVAVGGKATKYQIYAVFEGAGFKTRNLTITDPYGPDYPVCTTMQWDFKASQNSVTLTVEAPKTDVAAPAGNEPPTQSPEGTTVTIPPAKTPEQMQAEAEQSGGLIIWHEFTWWPPFYRLHFVGKYKSVTQMDVGIDLFGGDNSLFPDTPFKTNLENAFKSILSSIVIGMIIGEAAVWLAGNIGPWTFAVALISYIAYKFLVLGVNWNSVEKLWQSLIANFISTIISAFGGLGKFLPAAFRSLASGIANIKNLAFAFIYKAIMIPLNIYLMIMTWDRLNVLGGL
jgi:hypothetical protein